MESKDRVQKFIKHLEIKGRSPSTIIAYKKDVEQLLEYLANKKLDVKITKTQDLEKYIKYLINSGEYTLKTVSRKINTLKTFYKFLVKTNAITVNYSDPIRHPEFEKKVPRILTTLEFKALRDTTRSNPRLYTMVELLLQTGLRIGELSRLKLKDVKKKKNSITLSIEEFASNPERKIVLNDVAKEALEVWLEIRPEVKNDKGFLFPTKTGNPVLVRNVRTAISRSFRKVEIVDATVNDIRNTFIVYQLGKGMSLDRLANIVGHQRQTSTEKYLKLVTKKTKKKSTKIQVL